ncbi:hypothetical protein DITRI_Ditri10aG0131200 [Diplodiscus trichospermus]
MKSSCSFLYALRRWKIISFAGNESLTISDSNTSLVPSTTLLHTIPLAGTYLLYMIVAMIGFNSSFCYGLTIFCFKDVISVGLIVIGAFVAGARDLSFFFYGYAVVLLANFTTAIYLATIARIGKSSGLNSFGLMWCNGIICGPVLLLWTFLLGDLKSTLNFPTFIHLVSWYIMLSQANSFINAGCVDSFLYTSFLLELHYILEHNSQFCSQPVTQTICGNLKDLFTIGLGWILFGGLPFDIAIAGVCRFWFICLLQACGKMSDQAKK